MSHSLLVFLVVVLCACSFIHGSDEKCDKKTLAEFDQGPTEQRPKALNPLQDLVTRLRGHTPAWQNPIFAVRGWGENPRQEQPKFFVPMKQIFDLRSDDPRLLPKGQITHVIGLDGVLRPLAAVEWNMRPVETGDPGILGKFAYDGSNAYFNSFQFLISHLKEDRLLFARHRKTPQEVAKFLEEIFLAEPDDEGIVQVAGTRFQVKMDHQFGFDISPFGDDASTSEKVTITNLNNGKAMFMSALAPHLLKAGFCGTRMKNRTSPDDLVELLYGKK